jgi:hypothetical protein
MKAKRKSIFIAFSKKFCYYSNHSSLIEHRITNNSSALELINFIPKAKTPNPKKNLIIKFISNVDLGL